MKGQDNSLHILFCSRLVEEKGVDILLAVIARTSSDPAFNRVVWHIASDGMYQHVIEELAHQAKEKIYYHGKISQQVLADLMRKVDYLFMPSRFLETFWLTAVESLACGTNIIGIKKWWLSDFIDDTFAIDEASSVESSLTILRWILDQQIQPKMKDITHFSLEQWNHRIQSIFPKWSSIFLMHDYRERIGWAEAYIDFLESQLSRLGYTVGRASYNGVTSIWKRRIMFIFSLIAFWRGNTISRFLSQHEPTHIWMHSVLRYHWYWWVRAVQKYCLKRNDTQVFLSHHDVWFIAPFPHLVESESQIPKTSDRRDFLMNLYWFQKWVAMMKWWYITMIRHVVPQRTHHIIFAEFLKHHIQAHFKASLVMVVPHTYDATIFHP